MTTRQWIVVVLIMVLNALDGFDVLSSAFAAPGISLEWGISRATLGIMLSAELIGMGFGSVVLGGLADKIGRKPTILICLVVMAAGMYLAHAAPALWPLTIFRLLTGVGIGGMLAATNSTVAEVTSKSSRGLATALYVIGYPLGGVIGGYVAQSWLLVDYDWRAVFMFGAVVTGMMIPIVVLLVPETPAFHATRRKPDALARVNRSLLMLRQPTIGALSVVSADFKPKISDILVQPGLRKITWILTFSYMLHSVTLYYILKFTAQIVADAGFSQPEAAGALMWTNIGGIAGGLLFGFVLKRWSIKKSTVGALLLTVCGVAWFGRGHDSLAAWQSAGFMAMFFLNAGVTGCYSAFARCFQTYVRATGTGFALGLGRLGAAVSPILAGFLFVVLGNQQLFAVSVIMALGSLAGAILLWLLPLDDLSQ